MNDDNDCYFYKNVFNYKQNLSTYCLFILLRLAGLFLHSQDVFNIYYKLLRIIYRALVKNTLIYGILGWRAVEKKQK